MWSPTTPSISEVDGRPARAPTARVDRAAPAAPVRRWSAYTSKCNPANFASPARNDIDASIINLFAGHNRFHDFAYFLGFTEQTWNLQQDNFGNGQPGPFPAGGEADPELGNVQAGAVTGGAPSYEGRDNANQITLQDGIAPITNQYLFQPIAAAFYSPCVDGSFDTTVFGHEYTHAISNRMAGGPDSSLTGDQAGAMGESWSDLDALEYLHEYNYVPTGGENPWALGAYVTGNKSVGIRNYALDNNPLNYSDIGYDSSCNAPLVGPPVEPACASRSEVHSDGEIWNAVNYDLRQALVNKYNGGFPASNAALQRNCADGKLPADRCPGNRRWIQIMYDAWLLMPPDVSMLDARDAYLAADVMRFGGANQTAMWHVFAKRGMGQLASTLDNNDPDPKPSFKSPDESSPILHFSAVNENGAAVNAKIFVGRYEAAITPAADTNSATPLKKDLPMVAGGYDFVAAAPGYGHLRFHWTVGNANASVVLHFATNWASSVEGATASGDGGNFADLIDDTESTNWAVIGAASNINRKQVTVKLNAAHLVDRVQVSAMLHPRDDADDYDSIGQSRFCALRSFDIQTCNESSVNCALPISWVTVGHFVNAFSAAIPRPVMPQMLIKSFDVTNTTATRVRLVVLDSQCTGNPAYAGEQDNDPTNDTDCQLASTQDTNVRVAELQVFSGGATATSIGGG